MVARRPELQTEPMVRPDPVREATDLPEQDAEDVVARTVADVSQSHLLGALVLELLHHLGKRRRLWHFTNLECCRGAGSWELTVIARGDRSVDL
jgi:hypothetical protein